MRLYLYLQNDVGAAAYPTRAGSLFLQHGSEVRLISRDKCLVFNRCERSSPWTLTAQSDSFAR